ncbi:MAG: membrane protein insertion efficiency factor YidD [Gammaproteobacteria bacterium]|nr:membrane protein insertion efficiency factor YidD [Gammaproteobacteria bacterium]
MAQGRVSRGAARTERGPAVRAVRSAIRGYQLLVSPAFGPCCRHLPTCSDYAMEAVTSFGLLRGGWLAFRRVIRCNPWGTSGFDPVPSSSSQDRRPG